VPVGMQGCRKPAASLKTNLSFHGSCILVRSKRPAGKILSLAKDLQSQRFQMLFCQRVGAVSA